VLQWEVGERPTYQRSDIELPRDASDRNLASML